jgi:hypothetical protein
MEIIFIRTLIGSSENSTKKRWVKIECFAESLVKRFTCTKFIDKNYGWALYLENIN